MLFCIVGAFCQNLTCLTFDPIATSMHMMELSVHPRDVAWGPQSPPRQDTFLYLENTVSYQIQGFAPCIFPHQYCVIVLFYYKPLFVEPHSQNRCVCRAFVFVFPVFNSVFFFLFCARHVLSFVLCCAVCLVYFVSSRLCCFWSSAVFRVYFVVLVLCFVFQLSL